VITFLQPLALLGLLAAGIPPLLHLIERRTPPTVMFPAVHYLAETTREQRRRLKLRNLLLLLLRTGLLAILAVAAARPVAPWPMGGAHAPAAVAVVLDNSLSSGAVVRGHPVLDALREAAVRVLAHLAATDHVWLVTADGEPRRLSAEDAREAVARAGPSVERLDLGRAVRLAAEVVSRDELPNRVVVVLSDLQASALSPGPRPVAPVLVWSPPAGPANHGIDSAWADPSVFRPSGRVVAAPGGTTTPVTLRLEVGGRDVARALARPGELTVLQPPPLKPGWAVARVLLDPDELRGDDDAWLALHTAATVAARAGAGAGRFIADGLGVLTAAGRVRSGSTVTLDATVPAHGVTVVFPPADPALLGDMNRALAARGVGWRFGPLVRGEWQLTGPVGGGATVGRRHELTRSGSSPGTAVLARVPGGGRDAWMVRDHDVVLVASRFEPEWTTLPVHASFVPTLDLLVNRLALGDAGVVAGAPGSVVTVPEAAAAVLLPGGGMPVQPDRRITAPLTPGVYFFRGPAGDTVGALLVNHDARETQLAAATPAAINAVLGAAPMDAADLGRAFLQGGRRADLSGVLLGLALAVAVLELSVASAGGQRT
jgi:hypothetical protein